MRTPPCLSLLLTLAAGQAIAQPPVVRIPTVPQVRIPTDPVELPPPPTGPMTRDEAQAIQQRLEAYHARLRADAPTAEALLEAGIPEQADPVEQARAAQQAGRAGPVHVGGLTRLDARSSFDIDPGLLHVLRSTLRARLGRDPSERELEGEIEKFNARVATANRRLAVRAGAGDRRARGEVVGRVRSGPEIRRAGDPQPGDSASTVAAGLRELIRRLLLAEPGDARLRVPSVSTRTTTLPDRPQARPAPPGSRSPG